MGVSVLPTPSQISLDHTGLFPAKQVSQETAIRTSKLLQENHENLHPFFNDERTDGVFMHNHLVHHALTMYALGAPPELIEELYLLNSKYQRTQPTPVVARIRDLADPIVFKDSLGNEDNYAAFLKFFEEEIASMGPYDMLQKYLFSRTENAEALLGSLFMGYIHPIIHFGFGFEFSQPAILAEGLAQAACHHDNYLLPFFAKADALRASGEVTMKRTLLELWRASRENQKCRDAITWTTFDKFKNGIFKHAMDEVARLASEFYVEPNKEDIRLQTAEVVNHTAFLLAGAQKKGKLPRFDFFMMHPPNCTILYSAMATSPWLNDDGRARLLTNFGRISIAMYTVGNFPELDMGVIRHYKPKRVGLNWDEIVKQANKHPDDGHACKMIRVLMHAERLSISWEGEGREQFEMHGEDFIRCGAAIIDSLNPIGGKAGPKEPESWVRGAGFEEAWKDVPDDH